MRSISIKQAAMINFISKYSNVFVQLIINSVLARILTPDDYGVVAIITVFISFFTIIADMGIGPAIIQHKELNRKQISDIYIFTSFIAIITAIGFILFSYPLSKFYNNDVYISLGLILSIGIFFNVLNIVPNALLLKNLQFRTLGIRTVIITIIGGIITIILAINGAKYYALVINSVLVAFFTFIFNLYFSKLKVDYKFSYNSIKIIKDFSVYQFGYNIVNYFSKNLDNLLIGKFMGQVSLGYYDKAYKLMLYPVQNLTHVITPVLHPMLSKYHEDKDRMYNEFMKITRVLLLLGIFISVFCYFSAKEIILIMFGEQWHNSVGAFKILSITIWIQMTVSASGTIFQSLGQVKEVFKINLITTTINIIGIVIGVLSYKIEIVALNILISFSINFCLTYYCLIKKSLNKPLNDFLYEIKSSFIIALIMIITFIVIPVKVNSVVISISIKIVLAIISYIIGLTITKQFKVFKVLIKI